MTEIEILKEYKQWAFERKTQGLSDDPDVSMLERTQNEAIQKLVKISDLLHGKNISTMSRIELLDTLNNIAKVLNE